MMYHRRRSPLAALSTTAWAMTTVLSANGEHACVGAWLGLP